MGVLWCACHKLCGAAGWGVVEAARTIVGGVALRTYPLFCHINDATAPVPPAPLPAEDMESTRAHLGGVICRDLSCVVSNYRANMTLDEYLKQQKVPVPLQSRATPIAVPYSSASCGRTRGGDGKQWGWNGWNAGIGKASAAKAPEMPATGRAQRRSCVQWQQA